MYLQGEECPKNRRGVRTEAGTRKVKKRKAVAKTSAMELPVIRTGTAGIDIGATEIFAAVSPDRDAEPVRCFASFTAAAFGATAGGVGGRTDRPSASPLAITKYAKPCN